MLLLTLKRNFVMLDTIYLELLTPIAGGLNYLKNVMPNKITVSNFGDDKHGHFVKGHFKTIEIYATEKRIKIHGSLPKFANGNNFFGLSFIDQKEALICLGNQLEIPIEKAIFRRIDIGTSLLMNYLPKSYFPLLVEYPLASRGVIEDTLYFKHNNFESVFYDKNIESNFLLPQYRNSNPLRYEYKMPNSRTIQTQFKRDIFVDDLLKGSNYNKLILMWQDEYSKIIPKPNSLTMLQQNENIKNESTFLELMAIQFMIEKGEENILQIISDLQKRKQFSRPEYASRLKKKIREILKAREKEFGLNEGIVELNTKVNEATNQYLQ